MAKKKTVPKQTIILPVEASVPVEITKALPLPPDTTEQQDIISQEERDALHRMKDGQRRINAIWESTQGFIAAVLIVTISSSILMQIIVPNEYWLLVAIVVNSYFQRTNHTRIGGTGEIRVGETR